MNESERRLIINEKYWDSIINVARAYLSNYSATEKAKTEEYIRVSNLLGKMVESWRKADEKQLTTIALSNDYSVTLMDLIEDYLNNEYTITVDEKVNIELIKRDLYE